VPDLEFWIFDLFYLFKFQASALSEKRNQYSNGMDGSAFYSQQKIKDLALLNKYHPVSGANPDSFSSGTRPSFRAVRADMTKDDQSPPTNAKVKKEWSYGFSPPLYLYGMGKVT